MEELIRFYIFILMFAIMSFFFALYLIVNDNKDTFKSYTSEQNIQTTLQSPLRFNYDFPYRSLLDYDWFIYKKSMYQDIDTLLMLEEM